MSDVILTEEGKLKLQNELKELETITLPEIHSRMAKAREDGDLSENNAWITAKSDREITKLQISKLKRMLKVAKIISEKDKKTSEISIGDSVEFILNGKKMKVVLVPTLEADPTQGKLSADSPIGKAIIGHKAGEKVPLNTPSGNKEIEILK